MALAPISSKSEALSWLGPGLSHFEATTTPPSRIHHHASTTIVQTRSSSLNSLETVHIQTCILPILAIGIHPSTRNRNHDRAIRTLDHALPVPSVSLTPLFSIRAYRRSRCHGPIIFSPR